MSEHDDAMIDMLSIGTRIMQDGKRIASEDYYKELISITPELKARIVALLDGFSYYESVPISQIDECKAILKELGEDND